MERDIELVQPGGSSRIRIAHMGGGSAYALSYSMQKYAESLQGGEKPQIVLGGHYHKFNYNYAREIHLVQPGCIQDQTPFMRKKKLQAMVGGCTLWIRQNELGIITSCKVEWMPYYDKKFYAYRWGTAK
jgi:predicted phosphodiesterase